MQPQEQEDDYSGPMNQLQPQMNDESSPIKRADRRLEDDDADDQRDTERNGLDEESSGGSGASDKPASDADSGCCNEKPAENHNGQRRVSSSAAPSLTIADDEQDDCNGVAQLVASVDDRPTIAATTPSNLEANISKLQESLAAAVAAGAPKQRPTETAIPSPNSNPNPKPNNDKTNQTTTTRKISAAKNPSGIATGVKSSATRIAASVVSKSQRSPAAAAAAAATTSAASLLKRSANLGRAPFNANVSASSAKPAISSKQSTTTRLNSTAAKSKDIASSLAGLSGSLAALQGNGAAAACSRPAIGSSRASLASDTGASSVVSCSSGANPQPPPPTSTSSKTGSSSSMQFAGASTATPSKSKSLISRSVTSAANNSNKISAPSASRTQKTTTAAVKKALPVWQPVSASSATPSRPLSRANSSLSNASTSTAGGGGQLTSSHPPTSNKTRTISVVTISGLKTTPTSSQHRVTSSSHHLQAPSVQSVSNQASAPPPPPTTVSKTTTTTTASTNNSKRSVPTLAMSQRDREAQIKLLIKERDEAKYQAETMAKQVHEWRERFLQSEEEKSHVTSEADDEVIELRRLAQEFEDENRKLASQLQSKEQLIGDQQFKLDELECEKGELTRRLEERECDFKQLELESQQLLEGSKDRAQVTSERAISKAKYEREIQELEVLVQQKDETIIQLRSSLEMKKNELANLQTISSDLERKLKLESERGERNLKRLDEINLELKACEIKLATKVEESEVLDKQVRQLRQELRQSEEKLEQLSLARKKDVDVLHQKLTAARRGGSSTPTTSPQPYKTPTPQDEIVRLQMDIRDLKDQLIDREAELDCNRRDIEVMRHKMETRTLEVDCNNQELARRCQDLLEQNRQSEDTVKSLLKSSSEHSCQLMRATEDLKEANAKCVKMRDEINELERKLDQQSQSMLTMKQENQELKSYNEDYEQQIRMLQLQVDSLNNQLRDLCDQLDVQTDCLHKDREGLADQLSLKEIESAQLNHELAKARQDLRTNKLATQEVQSERDRLRLELEMRDKYVASRNDIIETLRHELEDSQKSLGDYKIKIEELRATMLSESDKIGRELRGQLETLRNEHQVKCEQVSKLQSDYEKLECQFKELGAKSEEEELKRFDEMRQKHTVELDQLKAKIESLESHSQLLKAAEQERIKQQHAVKELENNIVNHQDDSKSSTKFMRTNETGSQLGSQGSDLQTSGSSSSSSSSSSNDSAVESGLSSNKNNSNNSVEDYESQIEFLNSLVVDMQRKCDDYKSRLSQVETNNIISELDNLINNNQRQQGGGGASDLTSTSRYSTLTRQTAGKMVVGQQEQATHHHQKLAKKCSFADDLAQTIDLDHDHDDKQIRESQTATNTLTRNDKSSSTKQLRSNNNYDFNDNNNMIKFNNNNNNSIRPTCRISGRPYCDICQIYDSHHTMFCSKVNEKLASRKSQLSNENNNNINNNDHGDDDDDDDNDTIIQDDGLDDGVAIVPPSRNHHNHRHPHQLVISMDDVDALFRDYEQSLNKTRVQDYSSLRRSQTLKPSRPYCDHCDLFGHNMKACNTLRTAKS